MSEQSPLPADRRSALTMHWVQILLALLLPFIFVTGFSPAFMPVKAAVLVSGAAALCIAGVFWIRSRSETILVLRREHLYLGGFVAWMMASIAWSPNVYGALGEWMPLAAAAIVWFSWGVYYSNEDRDNRKQFEMIQTVVLVGLLESILVLVQYFGLGLRFSEDIVGKWRVVGTFGNPNYVAEFLVPVFFLALNLLHHETRTVHRRFYLASIFFLILAIAATWSRTGWLLLAGGLVLYAWIFTRQSRQRISGILLLVVARARWYLGSLFALLVLILVLFPVIRIDRALMRHAANTASISGRFFIWEHSLDAMVSHLPLGAGIGGYASAWGDAQYRHFATGDNSGVNHAWVNDRAHNDLIQYAVEGGIGVVLIVLFFGRILRKGAGGFRHNDLSIGVFVALLVLLVSSMANFPFRVPPNLWLAMFLAALVSQHRHLENERVMYRFDLARAGLRLALPLAVFAFAGIIWSSGHVVSAACVRAGDDALAEKREDEARDLYQMAAKFDPGNARAHVRHAGLLVQHGDMASAGYHAQKAREILPFPDAWLVSARVAASAGSNGMAISLLERRSTTYRKIPGYAADTIQALADAGMADRAFAEAARLNAIVGGIDLDSSEWEPSILLANGAAASARLALQSVWYPAFPADAALVAHDGGVWTVDSGTLYKEEDRNGTYQRVHAIRLPGTGVVSSLLSHQGEIFVGSMDGVSAVSTASGQVRRIPGVRGPVSAMSLSGNMLWLAGGETLTGVDLSSGRMTRITGTKNRRLGPVRSLALGQGRIMVTASSNLFFFDRDGNGAWEATPWILRDCLPCHEGASLLVTDDRVHLWRHGQRQPIASVSHSLPDARIVRVGHDELTLSDGRTFAALRLTAFSNATAAGANGAVRSLSAVSLGTNGFLVARGGRVVPSGTMTAGPVASRLTVGIQGDRVWIGDQAGLCRAALRDAVLERVSGKGRGIIAGDGESLCLASGGEIVLHQDNEPARVIAREVRGLRSLAVSGGIVLAGFDDGRLVRYDAAGAGLLWQFSDPVDAVAVQGKMMYAAVSGWGVYRRHADQTEPLLVLDASSGIDVSGVSAMHLADDDVYVGSRFGLVLYEGTSGSTRMIDPGTDGPVLALGPSPEGCGSTIAVRGDEVLFLGRRGQVLMRLRGGEQWPLRITSAAAVRDVLVIAGETGVRVCTNVQRAMQPWREFFRRNP